MPTWFISLIIVVGWLSSSHAVLSCVKWDSNMGATYDLTEAVRQSNEQNYMVTDGDIPCTHAVEKNYTYYFNVCGTVTAGLPSSCNHVPDLNVAGAVQLDLDLGSVPPVPDCRVVGEYSTNKFEIRVLDPTDPTKGLQLEYEGGEKCTHGGYRTFNIDMPCANAFNPRPSSAYELKHCAYTTTIPSIYGCPLECPVANRHLCGGHGECSYDQDLQQARCFCFKGHSGDDCNDRTDAAEDLNYSPALLGLIITLFVIIAFLVAGIVLLIKQVQAYKDDMSHYQMLKGDEGEGADVGGDV